MSPTVPSMHRTPQGAWTVAPELLRDLRLKTAQTALAEGDADRALVEAEELLETHPDHVPALQVVASAALQMGDAMLAAEAYGSVVAHRPEDANSHTGIAIARFGLADLSGALDAARVATALRPDLPDGWYYVGLAHERLGEAARAARAFARAQALAPDAYALPTVPPPAVWADAHRGALTMLPDDLRDFYAEVPVSWERFPALDELLAVDPPLSPFTDALYSGTPPVEEDPWAVRPTAIRLFQGNLGRPAADPRELAGRIARALVQEALDWLGIQEEDLLDAQAPQAR